MANAILWQGAPTSRSTIMSTELNSLAAGSWTNAGTEVDNSTNNDKYGWFELAFTFATSPAAGAFLTIYIVTAMDGTTYADGSSSVDPGPEMAVLNVTARAVNTAQNKQYGPVILPPSKFKIIVKNNGSTALASSGNTVKLYTDNDEIQ